MRNVNVRLHRPTVMPDACAEEGSGRFCCDQRCSQGRDCPVRPIQSAEDEFPWLWLAYGVVILATVAASSLLVERFA
jgi:hypothetical protein